MEKIVFSKNVSQFQERFQNFYTYYGYQQKQFRERADKATKTDDIIMNSVYNGQAEVLANVVSHTKTLITDFENLIATGVIKKET